MKIERKNVSDEKNKERAFNKEEETDKKNSIKELDAEIKRLRSIQEKEKVEIETRMKKRRAGVRISRNSYKGGETHEGNYKEGTKSLRNREGKKDLERRE